MPTISANKFAQAVGVSAEAVCKAIASGRIPATKKGRGWQIDEEVAKKAWASFESGSNNFDGNSSKDSLSAQRARKEKWQADIKEMEARQMAGELIEAKEVERDAKRAAQIVREKFLNLPQKVAAELACITDPHKLEIALEKEIREILNEASKTKPRCLK